MNPQWQKVAPYGLIFSLVALIAAGATYVIFREVNLYVQISLACVILGLAIFALLDPDKLRESLTGRQARYGSNDLIKLVALIGIIVVINYLAYTNPQRWDLTDNKENTLAKETIEVLTNLKEPVIAQAFYTNTADNQSSQVNARKLLENFKENSKGKFEYQFIDPNSEFLLASEAGIDRDGTIVMRQGNRKELINFSSEEDFTVAIFRLANPGKRSVYFTAGHGELDFEGNAETSISTLKRNLETRNYTVGSLNLLGGTGIPEDALTVIIAGPTKPFTQSEVDLISAYIAKGKSLIYLSQPPVTTQFGDQVDPMAEYLSGKWAIKLSNDLIIDQNVNPFTFAYGPSNSYASHPITQKMTGMDTLFPLARSIQQGKTSDSITLDVLVKTAVNTWAETDMDKLKNNQAAPDSGKDLMGPVPLAIAATDSSSNARLVVIGDADFTSDKFINQLFNGDFMTNVIDWSAQQDNLISLTPKAKTQRSLIPPTLYAQGGILLGTVCLIPGLVIGMGIATWISRRRKG